MTSAYSATPSVSRDTLRQLARDLGQHPDHVLSIRTAAGAVLVERYALNDTGKRYQAEPGQLAVETVSVRITDLEP